MNLSLFSSLLSGLRIYQHKDVEENEGFLISVLDFIVFRMVPRVFLILGIPASLSFALRRYSGLVISNNKHLLTLFLMCFPLFAFFIALSRYFNEKYHLYNKAVEKAADNKMDLDSIKTLSEFYVDFDSYPVCYSTYSGAGKIEILKFISPLNCLAYIGSRIFQFIIFPGSTIFSTLLFGGYLHELRKATLASGDLRLKIRTRKNDLIDAFFRRKNSKTLVIISQGNFSFAEGDLKEMFRDENFSTLCWNYPGYGCSTGSPFVPNIEAAIDSVYEYAVCCLKYAPSDIVVYGWSIGGYATSYIYRTNPDIGSAIVDAPFDHIISLAPSWVKYPPIELIAKFINILKQEYFGLDVIGNLLLNYNNPFFIIIRSDDQIIRTRKCDFNSNAGLAIVQEVLKKRLKDKYPDFPIEELKIQNYNLPTFAQPTSFSKRNRDTVADVHPKITKFCEENGISVDINNQISEIMTKFCRLKTGDHCDPLLSHQIGEIFEELQKNILK